MRNYNFQFAQAYQGQWNIPSIGEGIPGTLYIEKHVMHLDLFWNKYASARIGKHKNATGYAYAKDDKNKTGYYFTLNDLFCTYVSSFGDQQSQFKFEVANFTITDNPNLVVNEIKSFCIRTQLMDKWVSNLTQRCFEYDYPFETNKIKLKYKALKPLTVYKTTDIHVYIYFGHGETYPSFQGYNMTTRAFLNVELKEPVSFDKAFDLSEHTTWLLSLLWNNMFCPDFVEYRTPKDKTQFIYKQSDRYSYKYTDWVSTNVTTELTDFPDNKLSSIIGKWIEFADHEIEPLNTFFETLYNEHMPPLSVIKNFISTIDGLSADLRGETKGQITKGKHKKDIDDILIKVENGLNKIGLNKNEFNKLKTTALRESNKTLKERFSCLLRNIEKYVECDLEQDFCEKAIKTRNYYTHLKDKNEIIYSKKQFWDLSQCLEKIITAFILNKIGVESKTAQIIVRKITMKEE